MRWFRSLRTEGTALLLGFVLMAEVLYAWAALSAVRESSDRVSAAGLEEARAEAERFDGLINLARDRLEAVAEQPGLALWLASGAADSLAPDAPIPQRETLHYLFFRSEVFSGTVALVDRHGRLIWSEPYDAERIAARVRVEHPAVREALFDRKASLAGRPLPWHQGSAAVVVHPVVDLGGQPVGALVGEIELETSRLAGFAEDPRYRGGFAGALLDEQGGLVLAGPQAAWLGALEVRAQLPLLRRTSAIDAAGTRWLTARAPLRAAPWSVLVAQSEREAFSALRGLEVRLLVTGLLLGVVAAAFSLLVLGRLVRPLEVLTAAASGVPRGDFDRPVPERAPGELGELSRAFDGMRKDLEATLRGLRESEERYRQSIDSANDAIVAIDPVGLRVLQANRKACEVTGLSPDALTGRTFPELLPAESRAAGRDFLARVGASGEGSLPEVELVARDGARLPVAVSASLIVHGGGRFLQLICTDLSTHKRMERELVQAEKLSTIGVLAAGLLHELSTPLTFLHASLEEAKQTVGRLPTDPNSSELGAEIDDALEGARRANSIVRDLRIFARSSQGKAGVFDLNDSVRMALRMAQHELKYKAAVVVDLGEVPPVAGHANELSQVFLNLLVNAAHAIKPGEMARNQVLVATRLEGRRAMARVTDTGSGIPEEVLGRIFDPFFTTKPEGVGTGLGLAICKDIVGRLGGEIRVESRAGQGTTFTVDLPVA